MQCNQHAELLNLVVRNVTGKLKKFNVLISPGIGVYSDFHFSVL